MYKYYSDNYDCIYKQKQGGFYKYSYITPSASIFPLVGGNHGDSFDNLYPKIRPVTLNDILKFKYPYNIEFIKEILEYLAKE